MEEIRKLLVEGGMSEALVSRMDDKSVKAAARLFKIKVPQKPKKEIKHTVSIIEHQPKNSKVAHQYVEISPFQLPDNSTTRKQMIRVEAIEQFIQDLLQAKTLLPK